MPNNVTIAKLQDKSVNITSNGTTTISPDTGYTAMHSVSVDVNVAHPGQINFYDYEGTIVVSYTSEEIQALSELPDSPDHSQDEVPLTFDEWNWTLAEIKSYNTSYPDAVINVGANYHTTDGKNHVYFNIEDGDKTGVKIISSGSSSGTIDWGDGTIETVSTSPLTHIYAQRGIYHCILDSNSSYFSPGSDSNGTRTYAVKVDKVYLKSGTKLTAYAFAHATNMSFISIPNNLVSEGSYMFEHCGLKFITLPRSWTSITYDGLFMYCYSLEIPSIPNTITDLRDHTFRYCYSLRSVTIPSVLTSSNTYLNFMNCKSIESVYIPDEVVKCAGEMFSGCSNLKSVRLSNNWNLISNNMFYNCESIRNINIPDVSEIQYSAFSKCTSLTQFTIPSTVTTIGSSAFSDTYGLKIIYCLPVTPPTLGSSVFWNPTKIYVPYSLDHSILAAYQSATNWSNYASKMEELPAS